MGEISLCKVMLVIMMGIIDLHQPVTMKPINPISPSLNILLFYNSFVFSSNLLDYSKIQRANYILCVLEHCMSVGGEAFQQCFRSCTLKHLIKH